MRQKELKDEINKMGLSEKLFLVEDIWDSIATSNLEIPMHEWQKKSLIKDIRSIKKENLSFTIGLQFMMNCVTNINETQNIRAA